MSENASVDALGETVNDYIHLRSNTNQNNNSNNNDPLEFQGSDQRGTGQSLAFPHRSGEGVKTVRGDDLEGTESGFSPLPRCPQLDEAPHATDPNDDLVSSPYAGYTSEDKDGSSCATRDASVLMQATVNHVPGKHSSAARKLRVSHTEVEEDPASPKPRTPSPLPVDEVIEETDACHRPLRTNTAAPSEVNPAAGDGDEVTLSEQPTDMWSSPVLSPQTTLAPSDPSKGPSAHVSAFDSSAFSPDPSRCGTGTTEASLSAASPIPRRPCSEVVPREVSPADGPSPLPKKPQSTRHADPMGGQAFADRLNMSCSVDRASPLPRPMTTGAATAQQPASTPVDPSTTAPTAAEQAREQAPSRCQMDGGQSYLFIDNGDGTGVLTDASLCLDGNGSFTLAGGQTMLLAQSQCRFEASCMSRAGEQSMRRGISPVVVPPSSEPLPHQCRRQAYENGEEAATADAREEATLGLDDSRRTTADSMNVSFSFGAGSHGAVSPLPKRVARVVFGRDACFVGQGREDRQGMEDSVRRSAAPSRPREDAVLAGGSFVWTQDQGVSFRSSAPSLAASMRTGMPRHAGGLNASFASTVMQEAPSLRMDRSLARGIGGGAATGKGSKRTAALSPSPTPLRPFDASCMSPSPIPRPPRADPLAEDDRDVNGTRERRAASPSRATTVSAMEMSFQRSCNPAVGRPVAKGSYLEDGLSAASSLMVVMPDEVMTAGDLAAQGWVPIRIDTAATGATGRLMGSPDFRPKPTDRVYMPGHGGGLSPLPRDPAEERETQDTPEPRPPVAADHHQEDDSDDDASVFVREGSPARLDASSLFSATTLANINRRLSLSMSMPRRSTAPSRNVVAPGARLLPSPQTPVTTATPQWDIATPMGSVNMAAFSASAMMGQTYLGPRAADTVNGDGGTSPLPTSPSPEHAQGDFAEAMMARREGSPSRAGALSASSQAHPASAALSTMEHSDLLTSMSYQRPSTAATSFGGGYGGGPTDMSLPISSSSISMSMNPLSGHSVSLGGIRGDPFAPQSRTAFVAPPPNRAPTFLSGGGNATAPLAKQSTGGETNAAAAVASDGAVVVKKGAVAAHFRQQQRQQQQQQQQPGSRRDSDASMALYSVNASSFTCSTNTNTNESNTTSSTDAMHRSFQTTYCKRATGAGLPLTRGQLGVSVNGGGGVHHRLGSTSLSPAAVGAPLGGHGGGPLRRAPARNGGAHAHAATAQSRRADPGMAPTPTFGAGTASGSPAKDRHHQRQPSPDSHAEPLSVEAATAAIAASARFVSAVMSSSDEVSASSASTWSITEEADANSATQPHVDLDTLRAANAEAEAEAAQQRAKRVVSALEHRVTLPPRRVTTEKPDTSVFLPWSPLTITPESSVNLPPSHHTSPPTVSAGGGKTAPPSPVPCMPSSASAQRTPDGKNGRTFESALAVGAGNTPNSPSPSKESGVNSNGSSAKKKSHKATMSSQALAALSNMMALAGHDATEPNEHTDAEDGFETMQLTPASVAPSPPPTTASTQEKKSHTTYDEPAGETTSGSMDLIASYLSQQAAMAMRSRSGAPSRAPMDSSFSFMMSPHSVVPEQEGQARAQAHPHRSNNGNTSSSSGTRGQGLARALVTDESFAISLAETVNAYLPTPPAAVAPAPQAPLPMPEAARAAAEKENALPASPIPMAGLPTAVKKSTRSPSVDRQVPSSQREPSLSHRASSNVRQN